MHSKIILTALAALVTRGVADTGGCTDFAIQSTYRMCNPGAGDTVYYDTDEAVCSDTNWNYFLGPDTYWSAHPDVESRIDGYGYTRPDYFSGQFKCDNSNPRLDFYRSGNGYNVYCSGGDGTIKTYAGDRDDLYDGYDYPCQNGYWHWAYVSGFNPCWCS